MIDSPVRRFTLPLLAALLVLGCSGKEEAPMIPLDQAASPGLSPHGTVPTITGEAKVALDSGNTLYSAKSYALALAQYRRAAALAPEAEAPLFGMLMVANVTNDAVLTDNATKLLRALNDSAGADSTTADELVDIHSRIRTPSPSQ
ncbi:MAG: hypothetical protein NUW01_14150 [Gemmatimonadaceae bacterium]|nr:hypothetical protein [Gemmatimonadaceae bacterium]